jgi:hypothetical protein
MIFPKSATSGKNQQILLSPYIKQIVLAAGEKMILLNDS